ncbi:hypothetical protein Tco_1227062 [Tanacetum coccineum]
MFPSTKPDSEVSLGKELGLAGLLPVLPERPTEIRLRLKQSKSQKRARKLSHLIKKIKQGRDQTKVGKNQVPAKDKSLAIYMVQPWHRMTRQKVTQSFARVSEITFPPLTTSKGTEGLLVIEAETGGHMIHRMYVDGVPMDAYEHCFNRTSDHKSRQEPNGTRQTTSLTGFLSGETIWLYDRLRLLVTIGECGSRYKSWMKFHDRRESLTTVQRYHSKT